KKPDEDQKREYLRSVILPLALTLEERDYWVKRCKEDDPKDLQEDLKKEFFARALAEDETEMPQEKSDLDATKGKLKPEKFIPRPRRQKVAPLLYNTSDSPADRTRVLAVIGVKAYINEAESQAARLREMTLRTRMAMVDERSLFEIEYQRLLQRVLSLA